MKWRFVRVLYVSVAMFKKKFKEFKRKDPQPSFEDVIKFTEPNPDVICSQLNDGAGTDFHEYQKYGLKHPSLWNVYELKSCPGFIYITNPFTASGQRYWICRSLVDYTKKPSVTNIDPHEDITKLLKQQKWWDIVSSNSEHSHFLKKKLRWATMGYHHNWHTKVYSESSKDPFPKDLDQLCRFIIKTTINMDFRAEACIVNFYNMDSSLSGHTDRSEPNSQAPLISFSFGQSAIFLLGGSTLEESPHAILVESGNISIMFGESRLRYHGVPRILPATKKTWTSEQNVNQSAFIPELSCNTQSQTSRRKRKLKSKAQKACAATAAVDPDNLIVVVPQPNADPANATSVVEKKRNRRRRKRVPLTIDKQITRVTSPQKNSDGCCDSTIVKVKSSNENVKQEITELKTSLLVISSKKDTLERKLKELQDENERLAKNNEDLKDELQEMTEEALELSVEKQRLLGKIGLLKKQLLNKPK